MELCGFSGSYSKKNGDTWLFREKFVKNGVLAFFHALIQESECTFGISVTIAR